MTAALVLSLALAAGFGPWGSPGHPVTADAVRPQHLPRVPRDLLFELELPQLGARPSARKPVPGSFDGHFLALSFALYRDHLTKIDGPRCAHKPTCSAYARDAVARHGLLGFGLGIDRLFRGGLDSPLRRLPLVELPDGAIRIHDPVEYSAFFLEEK